MSSKPSFVYFNAHSGIDLLDKFYIKRNTTYAHSASTEEAFANTMNPSQAVLGRRGTERHLAPKNMLEANSGIAQRPGMKKMESDLPRNVQVVPI